MANEFVRQNFVQQRGLRRFQCDEAAKYIQEVDQVAGVCVESCATNTA